MVRTRAIDCDVGVDFSRFPRCNVWRPDGDSIATTPGRLAAKYGLHRRSAGNVAHSYCERTLTLLEEHGMEPRSISLWAGDQVVEEVVSDEPADVYAAQDDPAAFSPLYSRSLERLYRYLRTRTPTEDDAADLTQQAFLQ